MFKRQNRADYPPSDVAGPDPLPAWVDTYNRVKAAGLIPDFPVSVGVDGWPQYPASVDTMSDELCSWTMAKCNSTYDIYDAPANTIGISFDDGPQPAAADLYDFLQAERIPSTHFVIGSRIVEHPELFRRAIDMNGHIAVHVCIKFSSPLNLIANEDVCTVRLGRIP